MCLKRYITITICGLKDKEELLINYMSKNNIQILGAANTGVKGKQCIEAHMNYTIISTGVSNTETAKHGVSFIIEPTMAKKKTILEIQQISERITTLRLENDWTKTTYIELYAPMQQ